MGKQTKAEEIDEFGLTLKQRKLADAYLLTGNKTEAARQAGYKGNANTLHAVAYRELRKATVAAYLKKRMEEYAMPAEEVLWRLSRLAAGDLNDFLTLKGKSYELDLKKAKQLGQLGLVKNIKPTRYGTEVELYSAAEALVQLGKKHHLFTDMRIRTWRDDVIDLLKSGQVTPEQVMQELGDDLAGEVIIAAGLRRDEGGQAQAKSPDPGEPDRPTA